MHGSSFVVVADRLALSRCIRSNGRISYNKEAVRVEVLGAAVSASGRFGDLPTAAKRLEYRVMEIRYTNRQPVLPAVRDPAPPRGDAAAVDGRGSEHTSEARPTRHQHGSNNNQSDQEKRQHNRNTPPPPSPPTTAAASFSRQHRNKKQETKSRCFGKISPFTTYGTFPSSCPGK